MAKKTKGHKQFQINQDGAFRLGIACFALAGAVGGATLLNAQYVTAAVVTGVLMLVGIGWGRLAMEQG